MIEKSDESTFALLIIYVYKNKPMLTPSLFGEDVNYKHLDLEENKELYIDVLKLINGLNLTDKECRTIDRICGGKTFYLYKLFNNILSDESTHTLLHYVLSQYHPELDQLFFGQMPLFNQTFHHFDKERYDLILGELNLTDEQIMAIEQISNVTRSEIKLKINCTNVMSNDKNKEAFRSVVRNANPNLETILFGDQNTMIFQNFEDILPNKEVLQKAFTKLNDKYGFFDATFDIAIFQDITNACAMMIHFISNEKDKFDSADKIAEAAYKILVVFSDDSSNALDILRNLENYINNHNFKNTGLSDILAFDLPVNKPIDNKKPLTDDMINAFRQLIRKNGVKLAKLFVEAPKIEAALNKTERFKLYLMAPSQQDKPNISNDHNIYLYKELKKDKDSNKETINLFYYIMKGSKPVKQWLKDANSPINEDQINMLVSLPYDQTAENPIACTNNNICEFVLDITSKRQHTQSTTQLFLTNKMDSDIFVDQIYDVLTRVRYGLRYQEDPELALLYIKQNKLAEHFNFTLDVEKQIKQRDSIPDVMMDCGNKKLDEKLKYPGYVILHFPAKDKSAFVLGDMTQCCQRFGGHAEQCVIDGVTKESSGFYVLLNALNPKVKHAPIVNGKIDYKHFKLAGQGYTWRSVAGNIAVDSWENKKNGRRKENDRD